MYLSSVLVEGNLVKDPELAVIGEQQAELMKFTIAVNRYYKRANGKLCQEVLYIGVVAWGTLGKNCLSSLTKGRGVKISYRPHFLVYTVVALGRILWYLITDKKTAYHMRMWRPLRFVASWY